MTITKAEGSEFAAKYVASFCAGFDNNNHIETMKDILADKLSWKWSGGTEGEGSPKMILEIMAKGWGRMLGGGFVYPNPIVCVDTDQSRIVISAQCVTNVTGGMSGENNLVLNNVVQILTLNDDKKVVYWRAIFDNNNKTLRHAIAKVTKKLGEEILKPEEPQMPITLEEGQAFAAEFMNAVAAGFAKNNHAEICTKFFANNLSWDWSDGTKGEGSYDEVMEIVAKGWGFMSDSLVFPEPIVTVDTDNSVIVIVMHLVMNITGGLEDENNAVINPVAYAMHLNEDKKCIKWNICWDNNDPALKAAITKVAKKLKATSKVSQGVPTNSPMERIATGQ